MNSIFWPKSADENSAKNFQRISQPHASYGEKERGVCDEDAALVIRAQEGEPAAFAELIRRYQRMVYSLTYRMTGCGADAQDVAQEAFVIAYRQIDSFRGNSKFSTWLYRIAVNACLGWRRSETRRLEVFTEWALMQETEGDTPGNGDQSSIVQAALLRLPAKQRAAVMLTLHDGMSHAEAANVMNCSETTISWRVFAAKQKLKRWLKAERRSA